MGGEDLWKLKSQQPHLFARQNQNIETEAPKRKLPPGFEETSTPGWLYNADRQVFLETATQRSLWFDRAAGVHRDFVQGEDISSDLAVSSGAAAAGVKSAPGKQARHVVIMDLHKAAEAFKIDLSHLDRPAAMLAVYGSIAGALPAELVARALH